MRGLSIGHVVASLAVLISTAMCSGTAKADPSIVDTAEEKIEVETLAGEMFIFYQDYLKARKFGAPDLRFDWESSSEGVAGVNTIAGYQQDGLTEFYQVSIAAAGYTQRQVLLIIAHEIGHLLGDGPYDETQNTAGEGEADYLSGPLLRKFLNEKHPELVEDSSKSGVHYQIAYYFPQLNAGEVAIAVAALGSLGNDIVVGATDTSVVTRTLLDYPSNQARFDTVMAGLMGKPRPRSWKAD